MTQNTTLYRSRYYNRVVDKLRFLLGDHCHECDDPEIDLQETKLNLVIPNRMASFGSTHTLTLYNRFLHGFLPLKGITLLCDDCLYKFRCEVVRGKNT